MKTRRFDFNYRPLQLNVAFTTGDSVPDRQTYEAFSGEYTPDYTITPLTIQPVVSRIDRDGVLPAGSVNQDLANVRWYEIKGGVRTPVSSTDPGYECVTSGGNAGRIRVRKNAEPQVPVTLEFFAEYPDPRTGQVYTVRGTYMIRCTNATRALPRLTLDAAPQTVYNPLSDAAMQTVRASLRLGPDECPAACRAFVWEILRDGDTWSAAGDDATLDYDVTVSADGTSCTVDRSLMGTELHLRCRALYDPDGNPSGMVADDSCPCATAVFVRRLPRYEYDITGVPTNIPCGTLVLRPEASIRDTGGEVPDPGRVLLPLWYIATNKASGPLAYRQVAHGMRPELPTTAMSVTHGAVVGLDVIDTGPLCAIEDSDGAIFEDGDGNILIIQ